MTSMEESVVKHSRGWLIGFGLLFMILGCIGLGMVVGLTIASMLFFGVLLIIAGVSHLIEVFKYKHWKGALWESLIAVLYIVGGGVVIYDPVLASSMITMILAAIFIVMGVTRLMMVVMLRGMDGWGWLLLSGIAALALGIMILTHWPMSALWFIGMLIAVEMIVTGWTYILIGFALK